VLKRLDTAGVEYIRHTYNVYIYIMYTDTKLTLDGYSIQYDICIVYRILLIINNQFFKR